jgi:hypothetical protein
VAQGKLLRAEGHRLTAAKGKRPPRVADFENSLTLNFKP